MLFQTQALALALAAAVSVTAAPAPAPAPAPALHARADNTTGLQVLGPEVSFSQDASCAGASSSSKQLVLPGKCVAINGIGQHNQGMVVDYLVDAKEVSCAIELFASSHCYGYASRTEEYPSQKKAGEGSSCVDVSKYGSLRAKCSNKAVDEVNSVAKGATGVDLTSFLG